MPLPRYRFGARVYDVASAERWVYRPGRLAAISLLRLRAGDRVLVVGCGTGLDLPYLTDAVGPAGGVVGVDASPAMIRQARRKVARADWPQVTLIEGDAAILPGVESTFDAVLFTYSLSIIGDWRAAWAAALRRLAPGGRVAVVDTDIPSRMAALARVALWSGGVNRERQVWQLPQTLDESTTLTLAHGHIRVSAGTR